MRRVAERIIYRIVLAVWFSSLRTFALSCLNSKIFSFLFLDSLSPFWRKTSDKPTRSQVLFQRFIIWILRNPQLFISQFSKTLRVCITYNCNLSCKACYARGLQKEILDDMKLDDFSRLASWAKHRGWEKIRFLGGEPSVHPQFVDMLDICYRNGLKVTMPTNNLFSSRILTKLDNPLVKDIAVNYNAGAGVDANKKRLFRENLEQLKKRRMPFSFSYIFDYKEEDELYAEIFNDIKQYKPMYLRASLELPPFSERNFTFEMSEEINKFLFSKIYRMLEYCTKLNVPFYIYRPLPLCVFSLEQRKRLKSYSDFIFFTRCPISYSSRYGCSTMVTVNPDLSIFPCASVFVRGPNIFSLKDRWGIGGFYRENLRQILSEPLMDACRRCDYHLRFLAAIERDAWLRKLGFFDDKDMCQGGCANFRRHSQFQYQCHSE